LVKRESKLLLIGNFGMRVVATDNLNLFKWN